MDIVLTDEQKLLRESVDRFIKDHYEFNRRRRIIADDPGFLTEHWRRFADLGWLAAPFPEAMGGLGRRMVDVVILMEALGKGLLVSPYLSSVVLAGGLVCRTANEERAKRLLTPLMRGERHIALAFAEPQSRYNLADVGVSAKREGSGFKLSGRKSVVLWAAPADTLLVSARTSGARRDRDGISLFAIDKSTTGVSEHNYTTVDGHRASDIDLENVLIDGDALLGEIGHALAPIEAACDVATLAACAEAIGCMHTLHDNTLAYLKQREQFGATIGSFQALQHRMVDVYMACEMSHSLVYAVAHHLDRDPGDRERKRLVSSAKVQIGRAGRHVGQESIQLHGGMGMTDEFSVGHYFKRLTAINVLFGDVAHHLRRFRGLEGREEPVHTT